jgi:hypothetical protein
MITPLRGILGPLFLNTGVRSPLLDGLVHYWPLGETTGQRFDVAGSLHLNDVNSVGYGVGKYGNAGSFLASSSRYLIAPSTEAITSKFTITGWYKPSLVTSTRGLVCLSGTTWTSTVAAAVYGAATSVSLMVGNVAANPQFGSALYVGRWVFFAAWYDHTDRKGYITVNNETPVVSTGANNPMYTTPEYWYVGFSNIPATLTYADGLIDEVGIWNRVLTAAEITQLYSYGYGQFYSSFNNSVPSITTGVRHVFPLGQATGSRFNEVGVAALTDVNTVGQTARGPAEGTTVANFVQGNSEWLSYESDQLIGTGDHTFSVWVKDAPSVALRNYIWGVSHGPYASAVASVYAYSDDAGVGRFLAQWYSTTTSVSTSPGGLGVNLGWRHVVYRYDSATNIGRVWSNGVLTSTAALTGGLRTDGTRFTLGRSQSGYGNNQLANASLWTRYLSDTEIIELFNNGIGRNYSQLTAGLLSGLKAHWNLNEASGVRYDSHSGGYHLTDNNTVGSASTVELAKNGIAASFIAANSENFRIASPGILAYLPNSGFTTSCWVYLNSYISRQTIIGSNLTNQRFHLESEDVSPYRFRWYYVDALAGEQFVTSTVEPQLSTWYHIVCAWDGTKQYIRVNGTLTESTPSQARPVPSTSADFLVGQQAAARYFDGNIDELYVWDRVLTSDEQFYLYNSGAGRFHPWS